MYARLAKARIGTRLTVGFATLLVLLVMIAAEGIYEVNQIDRDLSTINDVNGEKQRFAVNWRGSVHDRAIALRDIVLTQDASEVRSLENLMQGLRNNYAQATTGMQEVLSQYASSDQEQRLLGRIDSQQQTTLELNQQVLSARDAGNLQRAARAMQAISSAPKRYCSTKQALLMLSG
jgi:methyl-accepting chemotaxis protein